MGNEEIDVVEMRVSAVKRTIEYIHCQCYH